MTSWTVDTARRLLDDALATAAARDIHDRSVGLPLEGQRAARRRLAVRACRRVQEAAAALAAFPVGADELAALAALVSADVTGLPLLHESWRHARPDNLGATDE